MKLKNRTDYRKRRHLRLRKKIKGTRSCPRICVCVTNKHMYLQFVDVSSMETLGAVSTLKSKASVKNNISTAKDLGKRAAKTAMEKGVDSVVFDRGGHMYGGRVKAIAEAARDAGLKL